MRVRVRPYICLWHMPALASCPPWVFATLRGAIRADMSLILRIASSNVKRPEESSPSLTYGLDTMPHPTLPNKEPARTRHISNNVENGQRGVTGTTHIVAFSRMTHAGNKAYILSSNSVYTILHIMHNTAFVSAYISSINHHPDKSQSIHTLESTPLNSVKTVRPNIRWLLEPLGDSRKMYAQDMVLQSSQSARCTRQLCFQQYCAQPRHTLSTVATSEYFPNCISEIYDKRSRLTTSQMFKS